MPKATDDDSALLAWSALKAHPDSIYAAASDIVRRRGFAIVNEVTADTGSRYFTIQKEIDGDLQGFRVRVSNHRPSGKQVRERHAFVTWHCVRRARRDLKRLIRRLDRLTGDA